MRVSKTMSVVIFVPLLSILTTLKGGVIDENEAQVTQRLAALVNHLASKFDDHLPQCACFSTFATATFPDPMKARDDLNAFAKLNESRLYKLLKTCMDVQTDLKGLVKATVSPAAAIIMGQDG